MPRVLKATENNRRANARYGVKESFTYRSLDRQGSSRWSSGRTVNMSARGLLATFSGPLRIGDRIELYMNWLGAYFDRDIVRLHLTAIVVRTEERGTALRILTHRFSDIQAQLKPASTHVNRDVRRRTPAA